MRQYASPRPLEREDHNESGVASSHTHLEAPSQSKCRRVALEASSIMFHNLQTGIKFDN